MTTIIMRDLEPVKNKGIPFKSVEDKEMINLLAEEIGATADELQKMIWDFRDGVGSNSTKPIYEALANIIDMAHGVANKVNRFSHVNEDGVSSLEIALRRTANRGYFMNNFVKA